MHAVVGNRDAPKLKCSCLDSMAEDRRLTLLRQIIALFVVVLSSLDLSRISVSELLSMQFGPQNLFSDMCLGSPNIHLVRIQLSLHSKI